MKLSKKDKDKILKKIRREEHMALLLPFKTKIVKNKKIYNRKNKS